MIFTYFTNKHLFKYPFGHLLIATFTLCLVNVCVLKGQVVFSVYGSSKIPEYVDYADNREENPRHIHQDATDAHYLPLCIPIPIAGLPLPINEVFGLEKIVLSMRHQRVSDIKIEIVAPDGTTVWLTNRNGRDGSNYTETCFSQRGFNGPISSGEAPFRGDFQPDGNLAYLNNGQNANGQWTLKIYDFAHGTEGSFDSVSVYFGDNPARLHNAPCSFTNAINCKCSRKDGRLLPDLVVSEQGTGDNMWEIAYNPSKREGMLMFEVRVMNLGEGPLELEGSNTWLCGTDTVTGRNVRCMDGDISNDSVYPRQIFKQNIYSLHDRTLLKSTRFAGTMAYDAHPGHDHYHADYYARFTLLKPDGGLTDTTLWQTVGSARKASFCLWDMQFCDDANKKCDYKKQIFNEKNLDNYGLGSYRSCDDPKGQGLSVGGIDWYGLHYDGQNLRLPKGTTNGLYFLKIEIDPFNFYEESDETNNTVMIPVLLRMQTPQEENAVNQEATIEVKAKSLSKQ